MREVPLRLGRPIEILGLVLAFYVWAFLYLIGVRGKEPTSYYRFGARVRSDKMQSKEVIDVNCNCNS